MIKTDGINIIEPKIIYIGLNWTVCIFKPVFNALLLYCSYLGKTSQTHKEYLLAKDLWKKAILGGIVITKPKLKWIQKMVGW